MTVGHADLMLCAIMVRFQAIEAAKVDEDVKSFSVIGRRRQTWSFQSKAEVSKEDESPRLNVLYTELTEYHRIMYKL